MNSAVGQKSARCEWLTVSEMLARGIEITPEGPNSTPEDGDLAANLEALYGKKYERGSRAVEELRESLKGFHNAYGLAEKE